MLFDAYVLVMLIVISAGLLVIANRLKLVEKDIVELYKRTGRKDRP